MQALKDAGILLAVVVLALSVRITPIEPVDETANTTLMPRVDAALPAPASVAVPATTLPSPAAIPAAGTDEKLVRCSEGVIHILHDERKEAYVFTMDVQESDDVDPGALTRFDRPRELGGLLKK